MPSLSLHSALTNGFETRFVDDESAPMRPVSDIFSREELATIHGKKIDPNKTYIVATIDYLANGGDYMEPMKRCKRLFVDTQKYGNHILTYVKALQAAGKKIDAKDEVRIKKN